MTNSSLKSYEVWESVVGYEGQYEVNQDGRIRHLSEISGRQGCHVQKFRLSHEKYGWVVVLLSKRDQTELI